MPIFFDSDRDLNGDCALIALCADSICAFWNENGGPEKYGVRIFTNEETIREVAIAGDQVLASFFPHPPGPFKRVAALVVLSRLLQLFDICTRDSTLECPKPVTPLLNEEWLPRLCYLLIGPALAHVTVQDSAGKWHEPKSWRGFPSFHTKAEFFLWLEWLCDYPSEILPAPNTEPETLIRRGRMVLGTSLILEQAYYLSYAPANELCGICDRALLGSGDFTGLIFDSILLDNEKQKKKS